MQDPGRHQEQRGHLRGDQEDLSLSAPTPAPACSYWRCEHSGKSVLLFPDAYQRFGKTAYGTQRYRCKGCGRTCAEPKVRPPTDDQLQAYKNATIFRGILAKAPVRRLLEAADIGAETFYARLRFFERQCLAFAGHRERRLAELDIDRLYLSSDQQYYLVNWRDRDDKRAIQLRAIGTADNRSRYVFAMNLNYDPDVVPEIVEADAILRGDHQKLAPFRRYARLWLGRDYDAATGKDEVIVLADRVEREIEQLYDRAMNRDDPEVPPEMTSYVRIPNEGMQVHPEYTIFAHFHHLRNLFQHVEKTRWFVDLDSGFRGALLSAFKREIQIGRCDVFYVKVDRDKTEKQRMEAVRLGKARLKEEELKPENAGKKTFELRQQIIVGEFANMVVKGAWQDLWMKHPLPTKDEPEKWVCQLTDPSFFAGDEHHLGALYDMASLRGIEQFFMQVRRRYSLLERTLNSASRVDRIWNIYSPYNPVVIQRLLNIYRVFYNYAKRGDDKKTPAMRIGLAAGPVDIGRIINFCPE